MRLCCELTFRDDDDAAGRALESTGVIDLRVDSDDLEAVIATSLWRNPDCNFRCKATVMVSKFVSLMVLCVGKEKRKTIELILLLRVIAGNDGVSSTIANFGCTNCEDVEEYTVLGPFDLKESVLAVECPYASLRVVDEEAIHTQAVHIDVA